MDHAEICETYRKYIACLNRQDWSTLQDFVHDDVTHNGRRLGLAGYRDMLVKDFEEIPDLSFAIQMLICDPPRIASRLYFDCTPKAEFLGLKVDGRRVSFSENVFYELMEDRIWQVWSVIDKTAIETQI